VHNISNETLQNIAVELQLRRRVGSGMDTKVIAPDTSDLAPNAQAHYTPSRSPPMITLAQPFCAWSAAPIGRQSPSRLCRVIRDHRWILRRQKRLWWTSLGRAKAMSIINTPNNPGRVP
jgi:hypothetical protein